MPEPVIDEVVHTCVCGCTVFKILASFDDYELASYSTDGYCAECGRYYKVPTPLDKPEDIV